MSWHVIPSLDDDRNDGGDDALLARQTEWLDGLTFTSRKAAVKFVTYLTKTSEAVLGEFLVARKS